jgi:hypothetical protein
LCFVVVVVVVVGGGVTAMRALSRATHNFWQCLATKKNKKNFTRLAL